MSSQFHDLPYDEEENYTDRMTTEELDFHIQELKEEGRLEVEGDVKPYSPFVDKKIFPFEQFRKDMIEMVSNDGSPEKKKMVHDKYKTTPIKQNTNSRYVSTVRPIMEHYGVKPKMFDLGIIMNKDLIDKYVETKQTLSYKKNVYCAVAKVACRYFPEMDPIRQYYQGMISAVRTVLTSQDISQVGMNDTEKEKISRALPVTQLLEFYEKKKADPKIKPKSAIYIAYKQIILFLLYIYRIRVSSFVGLRIVDDGVSNFIDLDNRIFFMRQHKRVSSLGIFKFENVPIAVVDCIRSMIDFRNRNFPTLPAELRPLVFLAISTDKKRNLFSFNELPYASFHGLIKSALGRTGMTPTIIRKQFASENASRDDEKSIYQISTKLLNTPAVAGSYYVKKPAYDAKSKEVRDKEKDDFEQLLSASEQEPGKSLGRKRKFTKEDLDHGQEISDAIKKKNSKTKKTSKKPKKPTKTVHFSDSDSDL